MWFAILPILQAVWRVLKPILTFTIPIPFFVILVVGGWLYFDQTSLRKAKNELASIVAGAQIKAAQDTAEAARKIADHKAAIAQAAIDAQNELSKSLEDQQKQNMELQNEIDDLKTQPVDPNCLVGKPLAGKLHNN